MSSHQYYQPGPGEMQQCMEVEQTSTSGASASNSQRAEQLQATSTEAPQWCAPDSPWGQSLAASVEQAPAPKRSKPRRKAFKQGGKYDERSAKTLEKAGLATGTTVDAVKAAAEVGVQKNVVDAVTPEAIGTAGTTAGALFGLGGHIIGDDQIAESGTGHVAASGAKTVCDVASSKAVDAAAQAGSSNLSGVMSTATSSSKFASSPLSAFVAALDGLVDVDNPAKLLTALTAGAHPGTVLAKTGGGGVDALVAAGQLATGNESAAMRSAELVEDKSVNGDYGAPAEAATKWTGIAMGDKEIMNKSTDDAAKQGRRGIWSAWGNAGADGMEAGYRGPTFRNADDVMRERYEFNPLDTSTWF